MEKLDIILVFFNSCLFVIKMVEFFFVKDFCFVLVWWVISIVFVDFFIGFCFEWLKDFDLFFVVFFMILIFIVFIVE